MKKNIYWLAIFVILVGVTIFLIRSNQKTEGKSYDFSYREFALENMDELNKIVVTKRNDAPLIFTRDGSSWMLNDTFKARPEAINNMLDVIENIRIDYVPPNSATENIMKSFLRHGIKVELYDNNDKSLKKYYVGSSPADGIGTYFVMEGSNKPLVMSVPTMIGTVHTRFNYTIDEWRDKTVLDLEKKDISSIEVSYPFNKKFSFKIENDELSPLHDFQKPIEGKPNKKMIETYLSGFENKAAEYIENKNPEKDSIVAQVPFCEIRIRTKSNEVKDMRFFYYTNQDFNDTQTSAMDTYNPYHAERFFIQTNWGDFYLAQHIVFRDIFWKYDFFYRR
jgi:hypothetical protein